MTVKQSYSKAEIEAYAQDIVEAQHSIMSGPSPLDVLESGGLVACSNDHVKLWREARAAARLRAEIERQRFIDSRKPNRNERRALAAAERRSRK